MIVLKINGKPNVIPTRWEDVTYRQYVALIRTNSLAQHISIFTGIPVEVIESAELKNLEKISLALSFLSISPHFDKTGMVGPYTMPLDVTIQSVGQFEALRDALMKTPLKIETLEDSEKIADLYLEACAIYCQKIKDKKFDLSLVPDVKEELKDYSCAEVIGTGAFFLFRPLNTSQPIMSRFRTFFRRLKKWSQGLPGYQRTLDLLQRSTGSVVK